MQYIVPKLRAGVRKKKFYLTERDGIRYGRQNSSNKPSSGRIRNALPEKEDKILRHRLNAIQALLSRLACQNRQRRMHRVSRFLPGPLYFIHLFKGDYIRERIIRGAIRDCGPGREYFEQNVRPRINLLLQSQGLIVYKFKSS